MAEAGGRRATCRCNCRAGCTAASTEALLLLRAADELAGGGLGCPIDLIPRFSTRRLDTRGPLRQVSGSFHHKIVYIDRLEFLWAYLERAEIHLPAFVDGALNPKP